MNKYIHFEALDFAEDPDFIQWVQSEFKHNNQLWTSLKAQSSTLANHIDEAIEIVSIFQIQADKPSFNSKEKALFERIEQTIDSQEVNRIHPKENKKSILRFLIPAAMAAAVAALVLLYQPSKDLKEYTTTSGQKTDLELPDQSTIRLDEKSIVAFNEDTFEKSRVIDLNGQAFFTVKKGKPFIVKTKRGSVQVLGTSFNVNDKDGFEVHCVTGRVKVSSHDSSSSVILQKGEICTLQNGKLQKRVKEKQELTWFKTKFTFENDSLNDVINTLEKQYQVEIEVSNKLRQMQYTGFFETGDLDAALKAITWPLRLKYEVDGESIIIKE